VTLVIVVAAVVAVVLLIAIMTLGRSRFVDESERFRQVSDLTSRWSRQQRERRQAGGGAAAGDGKPGAAKPGIGEPRPIDLRDPADSRAGAVDEADEADPVEKKR